MDKVISWFKEKSLLVSLLGTSVFLFVVHTHGFVPHDEGWFLQAALRMLHGNLAYRDFQYLYNPGSLYINILAFRLFGISILASRLLALVNSLLSVCLLIAIGKKLKLGSLIISLLIISYASWGPGHINFVWPVMFCLTGALASIYIFLKILEHNRPNYYYYLGLVAAIVFILKQNFGVAIIIADALSIFFINLRQSGRPFIYFVTGALSVIFLQVIYFLSTNTLGWYIGEIYYLNVVKIYQEGALSSSLPWQYPGNIIFQLGKLVLYLLPAIVGLSALLKTAADGKKLFFFPLFLLTFYFLSIRPTTDYIHLAPLLALMAVIIAVLISSWKTLELRLFTILLLFALALAGIYSSLFKNYYRWDTPLIYQTTFSANHRTLIWMDEPTAKAIDQMTDYFAQNAKDQEELFIYNFAPIYYVILDKKNPTRYDYVHPGVFGDKEDLETTYILTTEHLPYIVTNINPHDLLLDKRVTAKFVLENYHEDAKYKEYTVWRRN